MPQPEKRDRKRKDASPRKSRKRKDASLHKSRKRKDASTGKPRKRTRAVVAGAIVLRRRRSGQQVLVTRSRDGTTWLFPKGHVEPGETPKRAAAREVREEVGIVGKVGSRVGRDRYRKGSRKVQVVYYLLEYRGDVEADEDRETRWCTPARARRLLSFDSLKRLLDEALEASSRNGSRPRPIAG